MLLDTNVVIQLEEPNLEGIIAEDLRKLSKQIQSNPSIKIFYHSHSKNDIANDKDKKRRTETLSRLDKYNELPSPPIEEKSTLEEMFGKIEKINDETDCQILFALKRDCINYLITNDKGIHKRARASQLHGRVFTTREITEQLDILFKSNDISFPDVNDEYLYNIKVDDPIFNSLREDYPEFNDWFKKKCREQRKSYVIYSSDSRIAAICIYSMNETPEIRDITLPSMKLCTFKVAHEFEGKKYGELLLKLSLLKAIEENMATIWITCKEKHYVLLDFLEEFGFERLNQTKDDDLIFVKQMKPKATERLMPIEYHKKYSPHLIDSNVNKYLIPIQPVYLRVLFPEIEIQSDSSTLEIPGNTIKKVYLCHSKISPLPVGSIIFFYETKPNQCVQIMGIIENSKRISDLNELLSIVGKRSVYSLTQLKAMIEKKPVLVLEFRQILQKFNKIYYSDLITRGVIKRAPQSIMNIEEENYSLLKRIMS